VADKISPEHKGVFYMLFGLTPYERKSMDLFSRFDELEKGFFGLSKMNNFNTDIRDEGDKFVIESELAGFRKEDISLDINGDTLTISAKHNSIREDKEENKYIRRERSFSSYSRSFDVSTVDTDKINAEYTNGLLSLSLPKKEPVKPQVRKLEIKG
jgi:HSP20 family protein